MTDISYLFSDRNLAFKQFSSASHFFARAFLYSSLLYCLDAKILLVKLRTRTIKTGFFYILSLHKRKLHNICISVEGIGPYCRKKIAAKFLVLMVIFGTSDT